jgi:hypothetical protein
LLSIKGGKNYAQRSKQYLEELAESTVGMLNDGKMPMQHTLKMSEWKADLKNWNSKTG